MIYNSGEQFSHGHEEVEEANFLAFSGKKRWLGKAGKIWNIRGQTLKVKLHRDTPYQYIIRKAPSSSDIGNVKYKMNDYFIQAGHIVQGKLYQKLFTCTCSEYDRSSRCQFIFLVFFFRHRMNGWQQSQKTWLHMYVVWDIHSSWTLISSKTLIEPIPYGIFHYIQLSQYQ